MKKGVVCATLGVVLLCSALVFADGKYSIGKDDEGMYMQTESDGTWYIAREDTKRFRFGEKGVYRTGIDQDGTYIEIGKRGKFYLDLAKKDRIEKDIERFNNEQKRGSILTETRVQIKHNQVLVPVVICYGSKEMEAVLLMDTGASGTVLHRDLARSLSIKGEIKGEIIVAGGKAVQSAVDKLSFVKIGPITRKDLYVHIIDYRGPAVDHQGLLGMDFLRGLEYRIDFNRQVIEWRL